MMSDKYEIGASSAKLLSRVSNSLRSAALRGYEAPPSLLADEQRNAIRRAHFFPVSRRKLSACLAAGPP
jgi:hypothetical protein